MSSSNPRGRFAGWRPVAALSALFLSACERSRALPDGPAPSSFDELATQFMLFLVVVTGLLEAWVLMETPMEPSERKTFGVGIGLLFSSLFGEKKTYAEMEADRTCLNLMAVGLASSALLPGPLFLLAQHASGAPQRLGSALVGLSIAWVLLMPFGVYPLFFRPGGYKAVAAAGTSWIVCALLFLLGIARS